MQTETALKNAQDLLEKLATEIKQPEENRLDFYLPAEKLLEAVQILINAHWGYLSFVTGLDHPVPAPAEEQPPVEQDGSIEVLYHFAGGAAVTTLRVSVPYGRPEIPSVCDLIPSASLYERELMEMLGVVVVGTPNPQRLLLPDEWPEGVYPLRKSFLGFNRSGAETAGGD